MNGYKVNEIFYSIQGEGYYTGTPAVFVRFSGCNHACPFCDTDFSRYTEMTAEEIHKEVVYNSTRANLVVFTGGEPLIQLNDELYMYFYYTHTKFKTPKKEIAIETNGSFLNNSRLDWILSHSWVTCSPKTDDDIREAVKSPYINEVKVVYQGQDLKPYQDIKADWYYLQPCSCENTDEVIRKVKENPLWRLSLQTQKLLNIR